MDNWLYRVLKDTLALHAISEAQAQTLLDRIVRILFPGEDDDAPKSS